MRTFATGATRDNDTGKLDYDGFLSPLVIRRYAEYLHKHRVQTDGKLRDSDNWQRGIPQEQYRKSLWRHFVDAWTILRGWPANNEEPIEDLLCAVLFNASGLLHEIIKERLTPKKVEAEYDKGVAAVVKPPELPDCRVCSKFNGDLLVPCLVSDDGAYPGCFVPKPKEVKP